MTELEKKANISWDKNNTVSVETDNEDAYKAGYIAGYRQRASELEVENERLKAIILGNEAENAELKETLKNVRCAFIQDKNAACISLANDLFDLQVSKGGRK